MNRFWVLVWFLGWIFTCQGTTLTNQEKQLIIQTVRVDSAQLRWVEPGILCLGFTCPSRLDRLKGADMVYLLPVLTRPDGKRITFAPVAYVNRSTKRFLERRWSYEPHPDWKNVRLRVAGPLYPSGSFHYRDTVAVGDGRGAMLEIRYYYADYRHEYPLVSDTYSVPEQSDGIPREAASVAFIPPVGSKCEENFRVLGAQGDILEMAERVR